jgi:hypothetical protein
MAVILKTATLNIPMLYYCILERDSNVHSQLPCFHDLKLQYNQNGKIHHRKTAFLCQVTVTKVYQLDVPRPHS